MLSLVFIIVYLIFAIWNCYYVNLFFFKQKTSYDMLISDWSSDVCSSDLGLGLSSSQRWTQHPSGLPRAIIARWSTQQRLTTQSRPLGGCGGSGRQRLIVCTRTES